MCNEGLWTLKKEEKYKWQAEKHMLKYQQDKQDQLQTKFYRRAQGDAISLLTEIVMDNRNNFAKPEKRQSTDLNKIEKSRSNFQSLGAA